MGNVVVIILGLCLVLLSGVNNSPLSSQTAGIFFAPFFITKTDTIFNY